MLEIPQDVLDQELFALENDRALYLECLNNKPLSERAEEREVRDGLILFHHVYGVCRKDRKEEQCH